MSDARSYRYRVVDVFTTRQFEGNPLAVFPEARGLDSATMQRIAKELNLSETVFILPPDGARTAAKLRIFTPSREMVFAGHPTVGATFVLLDEGLVPPVQGELILEENIGPIRVRVDGGDPPMIWLSTPAIRDGSRFDRAACADALGLQPDELLDVTPQLLDAGNPTLFVALRDAAAVDRAWIDRRGIRSLIGENADACCVFVFTPVPGGAYSRMFAPEIGVAEDPATGSSTGPLALFMMRNGLVSTASGTKFVSEQGTKMGRRSLLHVQIRGEMGCDAIEVGGHATPVAEARITLQDRGES